MNSIDLDDHQKAMIASAMKQGSVNVPYALIKHSRALQLSECEIMVMIHLMSFIEKENNDFPTLEQLQSRMSAPPDQVISAVQKLLKEHFISIDEEIDEQSGIRYERYNVQWLYDKLVPFIVNEIRSTQKSTNSSNDLSSNRNKPGERSSMVTMNTQNTPVNRIKTQEITPKKDVFSVIEIEFGRPLTPMELETITGWLEVDRYKEELVLAALKEAVFAGKLHFRYIDRILLEWSRNQVTTSEMARTYSQKFRQK
jgi:DNA replication protein